MHGPVAQVGQEEVRDLFVERQQVALGVALRGPEYFVQVAEPDVRLLALPAGGRGKGGAHLHLARPRGSLQRHAPPVGLGAGSIGAGGALGHQAVEAGAGRHRGEAFAAGRDVVCVQQRRQRRQQRAQELLALDQGQAAQVPVVVVQQIERIVGHRAGACIRSRFRLRRIGRRRCAAFKCLTRRSPVPVERNEHAVEQRLRGAYLAEVALHRRADLRRQRSRGAGRVYQRHLAIGNRGERAHALEFQFEQPVRVRELLVVAGGRHGARAPRHRGRAGERRIDHRRRRLAGFAGVTVAGLEQQPLVVTVLPRARAHQVPLAAQAAAAQHHLHLAGADRGGQIVRLQYLVGAGVPDQHGAGAILALGNDPLEGAVAQRVVLGVHGQVLDRRIVGEAARHRPAHQHAVGGHAQVIMQAPRLVAVDHEGAVGGENPGHVAGCWRRRRLGRAEKIAFGVVVRGRYWGAGHGLACTVAAPAGSGKAHCTSIVRCARDVTSGAASRGGGQPRRCLPRAGTPAFAAAVCTWLRREPPTGRRLHRGAMAH